MTKILVADDDRQLNHLARLDGFPQLVRGGEWGALERRGLAHAVVAQPFVAERRASEIGLR